MGNAKACELGKKMDPVIRFHRFRYHLARGFISNTDHVLDLGCGTGYGTDILSEAANTVVGIDMDQANIDTCNKKHKKLNTLFKCLNLEDTEIPPSDVIVMFEVFEHLYRPMAFSIRMKQSASKYIIMSVPIGQELIEVDGVIQTKDDSTHHSAFATTYEVDNIFMDDKWQKFYSVRNGVCYIVIYYNVDAIPG